MFHPRFHDLQGILCLFICNLLSPLLASESIVTQPVAMFQDVSVEPVEREPLEKTLPDIKPENPLRNILQGIFGTPPERILPRPAVPQVPGAEENTKEISEHARDYIDLSAPRNAQLEKLLRRVQRHLDNQSYEVALEMFQQILELPNDRVSTGPGQSSSVRDRINDLISALPPEVIAGYQREFEGLAGQIWNEARDSHDYQKIAEVASRYFHTQAGLEAANYLVAKHIERGEWALSAVWLKRLVSHPAAREFPPVWYLKAAFAFRKAGMKADAETMLANLAGLEVMQLAGRSVNPQEWLEGSLDLSAEPISISQNWLMVGGSPSRTAVTLGESPVLVPRWNYDSTNSPKIKEQIKEITLDLRESGWTPISSIQPLAIGNRAVFRTMRGISIVEFDSGHPLWISREAVTPEQILTGEVQSQPDFFGGQNRSNSTYIADYQGSSPESQPLTGLLYRNALHGLLSSDGRQVFVIEQQAWLSRYQPGYYSSRSISDNDPFQRSWGTNQLVAYNLKNGRLEWEVGGKSQGEKLHLPLAGYYFLGPPLVDGKNLYVVGERASELRVFCLDAETGNPRWSTLIGYSIHSMEQDLGRRWWTSQPVFADGVLICPNTCGWLVAVDAVSHEVLWEQRFRKPSSNSPGRNHRFRGNEREGLVENRQLSEEWIVANPIVTGSYVLHAPREENVLICLDLITGEEHWSISRGDALGLISANPQQTILLTANGIRTVETASGKQLWTLEEKDVWRPSGTPACTPEEIYLPIDPPGLLRISRADGEVLERLSLAPDERPLGNLVFHQGQLLSVDALGARVFDLKTTFQDELAERRRTDPDDAWSQLREAQLDLLERESEAALAKLRDLDDSELPEQSIPQFRKSLSQALTDVIKSDLEHRDAEFERLGQFLDDDRSRIQYWTLHLDRLVARGEILEAFDECLKLASQESLGWMIPQAENPRLKIRFGLWLSGKIHDLRTQASPDLLEKIDAKIEAMAGKITAQDPAARGVFLELFPRHPSIEPIYAKLAETAAAEGQFILAEHYFALLTHSNTPNVSTAAQRNLAELYHSRGRDRAAQFSLKALEQNSEHLELDGQPVSEMVESLRQEWAPASDSSRWQNDWGQFDLTTHSASLNYQIMQQYRYQMTVESLPFLKDLRFDYNHEFQRLQIHTADGRELMWSVPLRRANYISNRCAGHLHSIGHLLVVLQGDSLTVLSPLERTVLWSRPLKSTVNLGANQRSYYNGSYSSLPAMQTGAQLLQQNGLLSQARNHPLVHLSERFICVRSQRDLQVFDTISGELLWTHEKLSPQSAVIDLGEEIYLTNPSIGRETLRLRLADASPLPTEKLDEKLSSAIDIDRSRTITIETRTTKTFFLKTGSVSTVRAIGRDDGRELWAVDFENSCLLSKSGNKIFSLNRKQKTLDELDLTTGQLHTLARLDRAMKSSINQAFAIDAGDRIYLVLNGQSAGRVYGHYYLPAVSVNGTFVAIDRATNRILWEKKIGPQYLLLELIEDSPVLLFSCRRSIQKGNVWQTLNELLVIDPHDGRKLVERSAPYNNDLQAIHLNHTDRKISLMSYNVRTILQAVPLTEQPLEAPRPAQPTGVAPAVSGSESASIAPLEARPD